MKKRYEITEWPSYLGSSIKTNSYLIAMFLFWWKSLFYTEVRLLDTKTGKEKVK